MISPQFIKKIRKKREFTQEHVADKLGISRTTYIQIENDERELNVSEADKLAKLFGMKLCDFLENKDPEYSVELVEEKKAKYKKEEKLEIRVQKKDLEKFKKVLLYILEKVGAKPNVGETVIYKLLYFIDFDYYEKFEENLIGATYIKNHHGPTPVEFKTIIESMEKDGMVEKVKSKYFQYDQKKYLPLKSIKLEGLSAQEIQHIDEVLNRLAWKSAKELSDYSHTDTPWMVHKSGEKISYESVFYRDDDHSVRNYEDEI